MAEAQDHAEIHRNKREQLLDFLRDKQWHSHSELQGIGGVRYSARIRELRRLGYIILDEPMRGAGKRYRLSTLRKGRPSEKRVKLFLTEDDTVSLLEGVITEDALERVKRALVTYRKNRDKL